MPYLTPTDPSDPMQADPITVYVSIGNTDGKLSHAEWAEYWHLTDELLTQLGLTTATFGVWHSLPATPYVNACWAVQIPAIHVDAVRDTLVRVASKFRQDSVAWAVAETEFLTTEESTDAQ